MHLLLMRLEHVVEVRDVADGKPKDLDLGQPLVRRERGEERPEGGEGAVEGFDAHALAAGVRRAVLQARSPSAAALLAAQRGGGRHARGRGQQQRRGGRAARVSDAGMNRMQMNE